MRQSGNLRLIGIILLIGIFVFAVVSSAGNGGFQFSSTGYVSAFQNPKAEFYGVTYNGYQYTPTNTHGASDARIDGTVMHFNPDGATNGKPTIKGEMTAVFVPEQSLSNVPSWLPSEWFSQLQYIHNPVTGPNGIDPPWNWTIGEKTYQMKEYDMRYYVTFSSVWSGSEDPADKVPYIGPGIRGGYGYNTFLNVGVWIKFDISPTWYIQGGGVGYLAIAECNLCALPIKAGHDVNGVVYAARTDEGVSPESPPTPLKLYYNPWGYGGQISKDPYTYDGKILNPQYFTNALYAHVDLDNFGVWAGAKDAFYTYTVGDVATFAFDIRVFVIGDYRVIDIQKDPDQFGKTTPVVTPGDNWLSGIVGWLSQPANIALLMVIGVIVLIVIFAPWLLLVIVALFTGGKKR